MRNLDKLFEYLDIKQRWKTFAICFVATFLMSALPHLGLKLDQKVFTNQMNLLNPNPAKQDIFDQIKVKLQNSPNNFKLNKTSSIITPANADTANDFDKAEAYGVIDIETGDVLAEKSFDKRLPIASITKLMTAVTALDLVSDDKEFKISQKASEMIPTKMGLIPNQSWSVEELLNALILTSANDAAEAIKEGVNESYGAEIFIKAMNEKAKFIGLKNSSFENPQGLDSSTNYSTVEDLAILANYSLSHYPLIREIASKDYQFYPQTQNHKQADLYNWNGLLGVYPGIEGIKIGNTGNAGYTTMVLSKRQGKKVLVVLLGAPGVLERDLWASKLLDLGFEKLGVEKANITETDLKAKYASWKYWN